MAWLHARTPFLDVCLSSDRLPLGFYLSSYHRILSDHQYMWRHAGKHGPLIIGQCFTFTHPAGNVSITEQPANQQCFVQLFSGTNCNNLQFTTPYSFHCFSNPALWSLVKAKCGSAPPPPSPPSGGNFAVTLDQTIATESPTGHGIPSCSLVINNCVCGDFARICFDVLEVQAVGPCKCSNRADSSRLVNSVMSWPKFDSRLLFLQMAVGPVLLSLRHRVSSRTQNHSNHTYFFRTATSKVQYSSCILYYRESC